MRLHDLRPAEGSRKERTRVGRGIAAGKGKTAGRGTKGQKARAGGSIPAWFEGGQTPLHQRIPKLRGFKNPFKVEFEVVNLGDIARLVELGELEAGDMPGSKAKKGTGPITVNQEILRAAGLVRRLDRPMKVLGGGSSELSAALFVVADAFSASARSKIEAAGGTVSILEVPDAKLAALGLDAEVVADAKAEPEAAAAADAADEPEGESAATKPARAPKAAPAKAAAAEPVAAKPAAPKAAATKPAAAKPVAPAKAKAAAKAPAARKPRATKPDADA
jgi:large subunit ribosomal protein L15